MSRDISMRDAINAALRQAMDEDERIILIGEDIAGGAGLGGAGTLGGTFGVTAGLFDAYGPGRVLDTPISETAFVGMALGAAMTGLKPVVEIMFSDFMGVCFDQIANQIAKTRFLSGGKAGLPLVIRTTMGAGDSSGAMHSQSFAHMLASVPGLKVLMPSGPADAAEMMLSALADPAPVIILEHKGLYDITGPVPLKLAASKTIGARVHRPGSEVTVAASGRMVWEVLSAPNLTGVEIIDLRSISPLDMATIENSVRKTGKLLVVDEGAARFGIASEIAARVQAAAFDHLKMPVRALTPPHAPVPYARGAEAAWLPGSKEIARAIEDMRQAP